MAFASLIICGANAALAQRHEARLLDACSDFDCDDNADCHALSCGDCGTISGVKRCKAKPIE
jgi:hypothetical protein